MGKRAATTAAKAPPAKKEKNDPAVVAVQEVLTQGLGLPKNCSHMLAAVTPTSLGVARDKRDEQQAIVVKWIEDTLEKHQEQLQTEADIAAEKLRTLEASKAELRRAVEKAETALNEKKELLPLKKDALAEATIAVTATKKAFAKAEELRAADVAKTQEMENLAIVIEQQFKAPLAAGEALRYDALKPFMGALELEESFKVSVSSSCCKTKDQRGPFEEAVLEALEKSLIARQAKLNDEVQSSRPDAEKRSAEAHRIEEELAGLRRAQEAAVADLAAAQKEVEAKVVELKTAEEAVAAGDTELSAAAQHAEESLAKQRAFDQGPLQNFRTCRDRTAAIPATAGA
jgi:hypothetical protein